MDKRPPGVTDRAQDAHDSPPADHLRSTATPARLDDPLFAPGHPDPVDHAASPASRQPPRVRVDEAAIEHPAPRRALSPAEALHLASGTTPPRQRRLTASPRPTPPPAADTDVTDATDASDAADTDATDASDASDTDVTDASDATDTDSDSDTASDATDVTADGH